ncbi:MAG: hypothetical protein OXC38_03685 [Gammaproteobacteria bacterium]|nr:hypothetical protein [Gammaproteobacteria bacterium]
MNVEATAFETEIRQQLAHLDGRASKLETRMEYVATKEDIADIKTLIERREAFMVRWLMGLGVMILLAWITAFIRLLP